MPKAQLVVVVVGFIGAIHRFRWFQPGCVWGRLALTSAALRFCDSDTCPVCEIKIYLGLCYWRSARLWGVNVLVTLYFSVNCHDGHKFINLNKFHAWESLVFFFFWILSFFEGGGGCVNIMSSSVQWFVCVDDCLLWAEEVFNFNLLYMYVVCCVVKTDNPLKEMVNWGYFIMWNPFFGIASGRFGNLKPAERR